MHPKSGLRYDLSKLNALVSIHKKTLLITICIIFLLYWVGEEKLSALAQDLQPTATLMGKPAEMVESNYTQDLPTDQIILKLKENIRQQFNLSQADFENRLSQTAGSGLREIRPMSGEALVFRLAEKLPYEQVLSIAERLKKLPEVEYAEPDRIMQIAFTPNDSYYSRQWDLFDTWGINAPGAWDITTGSNSVVVAVVDTGILFNHPDLIGKTVSGYDFISDTSIANDGDGRDSDPSDPGDWVTMGDSCYSGTSESSSWHGSHVAGTIAASTNNTSGIAGINGNSKILPVRVIGKCGGYESDIVDGMRWAAGLPVSGVVSNPNPARVLNLSFGGNGICDSTYQSTINLIRAAGVVIVAAAGNNGGSADNFTPANCSGVISVAATDRNGNRAYYSNYGKSVSISAPGGDIRVSTTNGILSTVNAGTTSPTLTYTYSYYQGTSMAAPHVAGVVSLMLSRNPALTPDQVLSILQTTAKPFPSGSTCNNSICGSGIVNAASAVWNALPITGNNFTYLPLILKQEVLPAWTIIKSENFEGTFPNTWSVFDNDGSTNGTYYWGKRNCMAYEGSYSAWAVGAGTNGAGLSCGANYPNLAKAWLKYGPFSLSDASQAELRFMLWLNSELNYDGICRMASIDGNTFYGTCSSGNSTGWVEQTLDLSNVYNLG
ncbi:MAG: S8 family serine peptidase, partial [Anaerolineales bacterium]